MTIVEYCDTTACGFNRNHTCSAPEVAFDEKACCITAKYDDEEPAPPETRRQQQDQKDMQDDFIKNNDGSWIKYI